MRPEFKKFALMIQDLTNPLHIYCRLKDLLGLEYKKEILELVSLYEHTIYQAIKAIAIS